jgi:hypothetical protein
MFSRRKAETVEIEAEQDALPPAARQTLEQIFEWACELTRPPAALVSKFHRERVGTATRMQIVIETELEHICRRIRILAARLDPVPPAADFREALRTQSIAELRTRRSMNPEESQ